MLAITNKIIDRKNIVTAGKALDEITSKVLGIIHGSENVCDILRKYEYLNLFD